MTFLERGRVLARAWSMQIAAIGAAISGALLLIDPVTLQGAWQTMPPELRVLIPAHVQSWITLLLFVGIALARAARQPGVERQLGLVGAVAAAAAPPAPLAWGARVSPEFRAKVRAIAARLGCAADDLMGCIAWESAGTFSPSKRNLAGSGATGLIQFMPTTALQLGTTTALLARMTALEQLDYVEKYFAPYRGRLKTLADLYMAILWPAAVGKPMDAVLWTKASRPTTYRQNAGLDANRDGTITKAECAGKVYAMLEQGRQKANAA